MRARGAMPATIAVVDGKPCIGLDAATARTRSRRAGREIAKAGATDLAVHLARGTSAATTVSATARARRARRHPRVRDRWHRRRASRRHRRRVARSRRARAHADRGGVGRREGDPRSAAHRRDARDARRARDRLSHRRAARVLHRALRDRGSITSSTAPPSSRRSCATTGTTSAAAACSSCNPIPAAAALDAAMIDAAIEAGARRGRAPWHHRQAADAVPPGAPRRGDRRRVDPGEPRARAARRRGRRRARGRARANALRYGELGDR